MHNLLLLAGLLLTSPPDMAEEQVEPLDDVVVTANISERKAFTTGRSVDAVGREDLERQLPESVPDALQDLPRGRRGPGTGWGPCGRWSC